MCLYAKLFVALLVAPYCAAYDVRDTLKTILDLQPIGNNTGVKIPDYMYELYRDTGDDQQYDVIRSISPTTESLGAYTILVYDLDALKPTETIQKAVLRLEPGPNRQFDRAVNVSFYSLAKQTVSKTYLGTASIHSTLDLAAILGSQPLISLSQLVVQTDGTITSSIGLVLYSTATAGRYEKGHELSKLLSETMHKRSKRSVIDNEIDIKPYSYKEETKRKKKKRKGSRASKLQAIDAGDTIVFANVDQCRMEKLVLNFADIGWEDWVISPDGFETNYCAGGCLFPLGKGSKPTNHATVQSLARSFGRLWDIPEPSCVPDTLAPLKLLYMDRENHVILKSYPDMRVVTCSCK